jgi:GntR family transcriptional regulator, histidine utilization repressor
MRADRRSGSHHSRIMDEMRQKILDGVWEPGHQLSKETDLAEDYGVSRMTMNKVLTQLSNEGFLVRRKRSGTIVAQPRAQSAVMEINDIEQEVTDLGLDYAWKLLIVELRTLNETDRHLLDIVDSPSNKKVLFLHGLHLARGEPFCLETRVIAVDVVPEVLEKDFHVTVPGQWLLHTMPWSAASHRIRAVTCLGKDAKQLELPVGGACLEILRKTKIEQNWVTHVRLLYPGESHQLIADFVPRTNPVNG